MDPMKEPLLLIPACKDYLWGGTRLKTEYHKRSDRPVIAESWELSCHPDGPSRVANGPLAGHTLPEALALLGPGCLGKRARRFGRFPLLIKLIDAEKDLSIQVHPDDGYALAHEGEYGKTEMWYVVDAKPGASLIYGFEQEISRQELARRMEDNTLLEVLHRQPVKAGDLLFLPAGTIHAICGGVLIAEIQQNSNTTYRVYDYGRLGADGKPRALHVEKALEVISIQKPAPLASPLVETSPTGNQRRHLACCPYFDAHWLRVQETMTLDSGADSFCSLLFLEGQGRLQWQGGVLPFSKGDSFFVPAGLGRFTLSGPAVLLATKVGEEG